MRYAWATPAAAAALAEAGERDPLAAAAEDEPDAGRIGRKRALGRLGVRRLGVVDEADPVHLADELQAVRHSREPGEAGGDGLVGDPGGVRSGGGRSGVLAVVVARDGRLGGQLVLEPELDPPRHHRESGPKPRGTTATSLRGLVLEDPQLRRAVVLEGLVAVEVIRREVEEDGDVRAGRCRCPRAGSSRARTRSRHSSPMRAVERRSAGGRRSRPRRRPCRRRGRSPRGARSSSSCRSSR